MSRSTSLARRGARAIAGVVVLTIAAFVVACAAPSPPASPTTAVPTPGLGPSASVPGPSFPITTSQPSPSEPPGPGALSVAQARAISADRPLRIRAAIVIDTSRVPPLVQLCDAMTKSLPPQCAGGFVVVTGISLEKLSGRAQYRQQGPIVWSSSIELVGRLRADGFTVME